MNSLPHIACLCPTYRRPGLLENAVACFEAQDYPKSHCELIILDDAGQLQSCSAGNWNVTSITGRYPSLGAKYNGLAGMARVIREPDILAVWEDDDIYLPHHLFTIADNMKGRHWAKPSHVYSLYTGEVKIERGDGRFHASLAMTVDAFDKIGGWPETHALNFDQQLFTNLAIITGVNGVYQNPDDPSYIFRWASTNNYHGQALGDNWYEKAADHGDMTPGPLVVAPRFDDETRRVYRDWETDRH